MIVQFFLFLISLYFYNSAPHVMDREFMGGMLCIAFFSIYNCFKRKEKNIYIKKQYLRHSIIFLLGYCIVFYQYIVDYVFKFIDIYDADNLVWYDTTVVCKALCMANIALNSFLLGYILMKSKSLKKDDETQYTYEFKSTKILYYICTILILLYIITIDKNYLFNGYGRNQQMGDIAFHIGIWIQGVLTAFVVIESYIVKNKYKNMSFKCYVRTFYRPIVLCVIMIILILMSGRRTEALRFILLLLISFLYIQNYKIKIYKIFIPIILFSLLFYVISQIRLSGNTSISETLKSITNIKSIFPPTQELAFNISSLHIALSEVPLHYPFLYGIPTLLGILIIIPGIQSLILQHIPIPIIFQSSVNLICFAALGEVRYYTLGTSILADIYINFGIIGIILLPLLWGILIRKIEENTFCRKGKSVFMLGLAFCIYTNLIYMCRGTITSWLASLSYVLIVIFLFERKIKTI